MTRYEQNNIATTFNDWMRACFANNSYPQILISMNSPDEIMVHRISSLENNQVLIRYLKIVLDQLEQMNANKTG